MISDYKPILFNTPAEFDEIEIYFAHDIHYGSDIADIKKWERFKRQILESENRYVIWCGDYCDNATAGSKGDIYAAECSPESQKLWFSQQLYDLRERTIAIVPGNHESNRITRAVGLFPAYDAALIANAADKYRQHFAFVDIAVGNGGHGAGKQVHYVGFIAHKMRDCKGYHTADFIESVDFVAHGHDHCPKDQARSRLVYDAKNKAISQRDIEVLDSGSFLSYGGYGADGGYRPQATKIYKLVLNGKQKSMKTIGFHI